MKTKEGPTIPSETQLTLTLGAKSTARPLVMPLTAAVRPLARAQFGRGFSDNEAERIGQQISFSGTIVRYRKVEGGVLPLEVIRPNAYRL